MVYFLRYYFILAQITLMRWFSFFTKFVFICNVCFLVAVGLRYMASDNLPQWLVATILSLGWFLSVLLNMVFLSMVVYFLMSGRRVVINPVLGLLNILISVFQFFYFIFSE